MPILFRAFLSGWAMRVPRIPGGTTRNFTGFLSIGLNTSRQKSKNLDLDTNIPMRQAHNYYSVISVKKLEVT
jgi:hypothetical protein